MDRPKRKRMRLREFDYSQNRGYFITICTDSRRECLSHIQSHVSHPLFVGQGLAPAADNTTDYRLHQQNIIIDGYLIAENILTPCGITAEEQLLLLEDRYKQLIIDRYVIMPNHIHVIFGLNLSAAGASPCPTISDIVCAYKSLTTRICRKEYGVDKLFQASFYDHVIRGKIDYFEICDYIKNNPVNWEKDRFFVDK